ncbi:MAG: Phage terminase large subunit (GpA) [Lentisphaerae bacterium ADurb.Bin242]|nr:MAG: Phage terminase large subunit (GpA) [Lentisphaerae bacterium ADurb.Bin242]
MPMNPSELRPIDTVRLLNSTVFGAVLGDRQLRRHRERAGFRISGDGGETVSLFKYGAWLREELYRREMNPPRTYEEKKENARKRNQALALMGRDIGELPAVVNQERKKNCERNFRLFCESYFPETFTLAWSPDHLKVIAKIETAVLSGGLFALAMSRGSGKSSLTETAALWAMLYGHREFVTLIGATESAALEMLDSIKTELEVNERLAEDFPEVCFPIAQLEGIANRCAGQLHHGERTRITWTSNEIVLPTIEGSKASGIVVRVAGITGRVRGMKYKRADGRSVRPSLVIIDDPQTSESAGSLEQTRKRVRVLAGDILGLAGPGQKISGIMPCTIIRPGDMADIILNRNTHPDWNGEKTRMVYAFPTNMKLWEEYAEIRAETLRTDGNFQKATEFYLARRADMDAGAVVSWEARFNHDEASALQHAMNLKFQDEAAFASEYQNDPLPEDTLDNSMLSVDAICDKVNGLAKGKVPLACDRLTMFVDVQKTLLFYVVIAWAENFTGAVVEYGTYPDQHRRQFSLSDANPTIQSVFPNAGLEGGLYAALNALTEDCLGREWEREDGAMLKIERAMVDANWGQSTDLVYQFCRASAYSGILMPSHGRYVGASSKPMTEYRKQPGDRLGFNWMIPNVAGKRAIRHVIYDSNYWKSFVHARLAVPLGDKGSLSLYGRVPGVHQLLAEHLTAEYRVKTQGRGRTVDEWKLKPERSDNHWLDCCAGCAVCGSMLGAALPELKASRTAAKPRIRLSDKLRGGSAIPSAQVQQTTTGKLKLSEIRRQKHG